MQMEERRTTTTHYYLASIASAVKSTISRKSVSIEESVIKWKDKDEEEFAKPKTPEEDAALRQSLTDKAKQRFASMFKSAKKTKPNHNPQAK